MSFISLDTPSVEASATDLQNLVKFIFIHEALLKHFGALKITLKRDCQLALKKNRTNFSKCTDVQQGLKIREDELIYTVHTAARHTECIDERTLPQNEKTFWSSMLSSHEEQPLSNVSTFTNKSFYRSPPHKTYFDLRRIPHQSLLKVGGRKTTRLFLPTLQRAEGPGAIFPLASARQRLFLLDYHHTGGIRHWYIVPAQERAMLQELIDQQSSHNCIEHNNLLIDPSVFDKHNIRYHRLAQHPNEFVVLAAGALAQSFTEGASWNESIAFALPSWLNDGHAGFAVPSCSCSHDVKMETEKVDINLFRSELVQRYCTQHLSTNCASSFVTADMTTNNSPADGFSSHEDVFSMLNEPFTNFCGNLSPQLILHPLKMNSSIPCYQTRNTERPISLLADQLESAGRSVASDQIGESPQILQLFSTQSNTDNQSLSFHDLIMTLPISPVAVVSTESQTDQQADQISCNEQYLNGSSINLSSSSRNDKEKRGRKKKQPSYLDQKNRKTLIMFGIKDEVSISDIRRHFDGCRKLTIKRNQMDSPLRYAFVCHYTYRQADRNRHKPINFQIFGPECRVKMAYDRAYARMKEGLCNKRNIVVTRIPENVSEQELRTLFEGCYSLKYCVAHSVNTKRNPKKHRNQTKVLYGYAFLGYKNTQQAAEVVENSARYHIRDQPLTISYYSPKK